METDFTGAAVMMRNSGTGNFITIGTLWNSGQKMRMAKWTDPATISSQSNVSVTGNGIDLTLKLTDNGTNISLGYSLDGGASYTTMLNETRATFLGTPDQIGLVIDKNTATAGTVSIGAYGWQIQ